MTITYSSDPPKDMKHHETLNRGPGVGKCLNQTSSNYGPMPQKMERQATANLGPLK